jgi:predicted unusual protein kinase regulating ubiquinone biosynthesis (AarF/ABC1/UbiB family)
MLRSGSICVNFLYNYLLGEASITSSENEKGGDILVKKATKLKCLSDTFQSYGGVLAKLSQIICLGENDQNNSVFSDCKPFSTEKTSKYIKNLFETDKIFFKDVKSIEYEVYKSGSVGQVHKAIYQDDKKIVIKVQYVGLKEQVKTDLYILDTIITYLYSFANLNNAIEDIKNKLEEELDYNIEYHNQHIMYDNWKDCENVKIAELIPSISNEKILSMYFIEGENLNEFILNSTQEQKNKIGMTIVDFVFTNIYKYNILYSDIHYGNFIVQNKELLYVMDFGCIHDIDDILLDNLVRLYKALLNNDKDTFYNIVKNMEIIDDNITPESKEYIYEYFKIQYEPWLNDEFEFTSDWVKKTDYKNTDLMRSWNIPSNLVYFNKLPYGMYHILGKMNLKGDFLTYFKKLLNI